MPSHDVGAPGGAAAMTQVRSEPGLPFGGVLALILLGVAAVALAASVALDLTLYQSATLGLLVLGVSLAALSLVLAGRPDAGPVGEGGLRQAGGYASAVGVAFGVHAYGMAGLPVALAVALVLVATLVVAFRRERAA